MAAPFYNFVTFLDPFYRVFKLILILGVPAAGPNLLIADYGLVPYIDGIKIRGEVNYWDA